MQTAAYTEKEMLDIANLFVARSHLTDENDREDLRQELLLGMHNAARKADPEQNVKAFQYVTAKGISLDFFNGLMDRNKRFQTTLNAMAGEGEDRTETVYLHDSGTPTGLDNLLTSDRSQAIASAIDNLTDREKMVVQRHIANGETLTAIAESEGYTLQYASLLWVTAKGKLAKMLAEWEPVAA
jgi:RNA polymerase sigma factor (sigma-70 family)